MKVNIIIHARCSQPVGVPETAGGGLTAVPTDRNQRLALAFVMDHPAMFRYKTAFVQFMLMINTDV